MRSKIMKVSLKMKVRFSYIVLFMVCGLVYGVLLLASHCNGDANLFKKEFIKKEEYNDVVLQL
jgi:hypothetical protein